MDFMCSCMASVSLEGGLRVPWALCLGTPWECSAPGQCPWEALSLHGVQIPVCTLLGWYEEQEDMCHRHGDPSYPASPLPLLVAVMAHLQLGVLAQAWGSVVSQLPLVSCECWEWGSYSRAALCPALWAGSLSLCPSPVGPSSPAALGKQNLASTTWASCCVPREMLQEGLVTLRLWHRDCAMSFSCPWIPAAPSQLVLDPTSWLLGMDDSGQACLKVIH